MKGVQGMSLKLGALDAHSTTLSTMQEFFRLALFFGARIRAEKPSTRLPHQIFYAAPGFASAPRRCT